MMFRYFYSTTRPRYSLTERWVRQPIWIENSSLLRYMIVYVQWDILGHIECLHSRPSALGDPGQLLEDWGERSTSVVTVPDSVSQSTAYTAKTFLCALLPQMGRVVFWVRGSVAQDRTPPEELNGLYETENSVVWLALCIGSFQSDGCRVLSTSLARANSLGPLLHGRRDARHVRLFRSAHLSQNLLLNRLCLLGCTRSLI